MNIGKLSHGGGINSDICNVTRKKRRLLLKAVKQADLEMSTYNEKVHEIDCWVHLKNVWWGGMTRAL